MALHRSLTVKPLRLPMRAHEFITETTVSGGIATVAMPMGAVLSRTQPIVPADKYKKNSRKKKPNAVRRFENSISQ
jgi:hypothetical protein